MSAEQAFTRLVQQLDAIAFEQRQELVAFRITLQCALERLARSSPEGHAAFEAVVSDALGAAARQLPDDGEPPADFRKRQEAVRRSLVLLFGDIRLALQTGASN